jgi:hypothetical protein
VKRRSHGGRRLGAGRRRLPKYIRVIIGNRCNGLKKEHLESLAIAAHEMRRPIALKQAHVEIMKLQKELTDDRRRIDLLPKGTKRDKAEEQYKLNITRQKRNEAENTARASRVNLSSREQKHFTRYVRIESNKRAYRVRPKIIKQVADEMRSFVAQMTGRGGKKPFKLTERIVKTCWNEVQTTD